MFYIQRQSEEELETVDQFDTLKEAKENNAVYQLSDCGALYYISTRACKEWYKSKK